MRRGPRRAVIFSLAVVLLLLLTLLFGSLIHTGPDAPVNAPPTHDPNPPAPPTPTPAPTPGPLDGRVIVLDPGHGGIQPGTLSMKGLEPQLIEKDVVLEVALQMRDTLTALGAEVLLTRDSDRCILEDDDNDGVFTQKEIIRELRLRIDTANDADADVFLSIHCDSYEADPTVRGTRIYYYDTGADFDLDGLADALTSAVNRAGISSKNVKNFEQEREQSFQVLRQAEVPAMLIELGFMSNAEDNQKFADPAWLRSCSDALCEGLQDYLSAG